MTALCYPTPTPCDPDGRILGDRRTTNARALEVWLREFTDDFPSGPQGILVIEGRKLEGSVPVAGPRLKHLIPGVREDTADLDWLVLGWLRFFFPRCYSAIEGVYLDDSKSISELDRLYDKAAKGDTASKITLGRIAKGKKLILDALDFRSVELPDPGDDFALRAQGNPASRRVRVRDSFLMHRGDILEREKLRGRKAEAEAVRRTAEETAYGAWQVRDVTKDLRQFTRRKK